MLLRQICLGNFVQAIVPVVGMALDDAVLGPPCNRVLMDIEARRRFLPCQHATLAQAIVARAQFVLVHEIGNAQGREAGLVPVLNEFPEAQLKERHPAWKDNFDTIRDALASAHPRPRSMRWRNVEKELARQIRNAEFADSDGLFRFVEDTQSAV